jgi:hypothetical protein
MADDNANQANTKDAQNNSAMKAKEDAMLIAHALGMAMDGSSLQSLADELHNAGNAEEHLRKHARSAFDGSERLMQVAGTQVGSGKTNTKNNDPEPKVDAKAAANESPQELSRRFFIAASTYSETLRRMSTAADNANRPNANVNAAPAGGINHEQENVATVAVLNHGLCEVIAAWKIRTEAEKSGNSGTKSESCQKLIEHAQQMDREGRDLIGTFTRANREERANANERQMAPQIQTLLRQADEILISLDGLSNRGNDKNNDDNKNNDNNR